MSVSLSKEKLPVLNAHVQSTIEMKRQYAYACIGGALNTCIRRAMAELERHAKERVKLIQDERDAKAAYLANKKAKKLEAKQLAEAEADALATAAGIPLPNRKPPAKPRKSKRKPRRIVDIHVERMRDIAQTISSVPRIGDITARIKLFIDRVHDLQAKDFYALDDHSSAAAFEVADEILPFAKKVKSQLHIAMAYPDKAAALATKIESAVRSL